MELLFNYGDTTTVSIIKSTVISIRYANVINVSNQVPFMTLQNCNVRRAVSEK